MRGISIREFARRDKCSEALVRRAIQRGRLTAFRDGSVNPELVGSDWRKGNRERADGVRTGDAEYAADANLEAAAERILRTRGMLTKAQAETVKENALAALRELQLAREINAVVDISVVAAEQARSDAIVRNLCSALGAQVAPTIALITGAPDTEPIKAAVDDAVDRMFDVLHRGDGDAS